MARLAETTNRRNIWIPPIYLILALLAELSWFPLVCSLVYGEFLFFPLACPMFSDGLCSFARCVCVITIDVHCLRLLSVDTGFGHLSLVDVVSVILRCFLLVRRLVSVIYVDIRLFH